MSSSKANSGKQTSLLNFFQKTPKDDSKDDKKTGKSSPSTPTSSNAFSPGNYEKRFKSVFKASESKTPESKMEIDGEKENVDISAKRQTPERGPAPAVKRMRVIFSSDEDDDITPILKIRTPKTPNESAILSDDEEIIKKNDDRPLPTPIEPSTFENNKSTPVARKKLVSQTRDDSKLEKNLGNLIDSLKFDETAEVSDLSLTQRSKHFNGSKGIDLSGDTTSCERFPHLDLQFLKPDKICDAEQRPLNHPNYDPKTLWVPKDFMQKQTPGHQQWWQLKSKNFDTILFFKVGKFYELYHMDAVIAVECLNLTYMRGKYAHCGFPEIGYGRFADQLVNRGYKVARVEQTETPQQLEARCKKTNVKEKVVRREICRITTKSTKSYGILDGTDSRETDGCNEIEANYLMAINEQTLDDGFKFGICFVDCSTGKFQLSQFNDDANLSTLKTLLAHNYPTQLLYQKNNLSNSTSQFLNTLLANVHQQALVSGKEFLTAQNTLKLLQNEIYFGEDFENWPEIFHKFIPDLASGITSENCKEFELCLSAFGAIIWFLQTCLIDVELVTMKLFSEYTPINSKKLIENNSNNWKNVHMILDGNSLLNLHVLPKSLISGMNMSSGISSTTNNNATSASSTFRRATRSADLQNSSKFSLLNTINKCVTAFGKRLLQQWVCAPTCDPDILLNRQKALRLLVETPAGNSFMEKAVEILKKIPDLERIFQRIHTIGLKYRAEKHPDGRAQLFDSDRYNQRKVKDLLIGLDGLIQVKQLENLYKTQRSKHGFNASKLLEECFGDNFPKLEEDLKHFTHSFNRSEALKQGVIIPNSGVDKEYDQITIQIAECEQALNKYLQKQIRKFNSNEIQFCGTGRNRYQLEIPEKLTKNIGDDYDFTSQRKGYKRYTTAELGGLIADIQKVETLQSSITCEVTRRVFEDFDNRKNNWAQVVKSVAEFDCIISLARYSQTSGLKMCFPEFVFDSGKPLLEIQSGYHPALVSSGFSMKSSGKSENSGKFDYIPNDCVLGGENGVGEESPKTILLTGANMGGKSTLMRQVSSLIILAQIGSMIPADKMRLTPVDRIFCRIGASDRLSAGQSTFYVELAETNMILGEASQHSLVLIDELGRGTSTHDGTVIANAVLNYIVENIGCRMIFSTHYHTICKKVVENSALTNKIRLAHMACMVENENTEDPTEENITFLYTLSDGPASKSYGFYTAKVAGINVEVVRRAFAASKLLNSADAEFAAGLRNDQKTN